MSNCNYSNLNNHKMLNVLLVHNYYQQSGGEDTVFENEKKLLESYGHKVTTYTRHNDEIKVLNPLKLFLLLFSTIFNIKTYNDVKKLIRDKDIDVVHVHNTLPIISPSVFYAASKMKVPIVQTLHNFRMQCPNGLFYRDGHICEDCIDIGLSCALKHRCYRGSFFQTLALVILSKVHRLTGIYKKVNYICLTEFNRKKLLLLNRKKMIVDENKIFVKANFVFDMNTKNKINSETDKVEKKKYYLFVGRFDDIKGVDLVLKAFSAIGSKEIHIIGSGNDKLVEEYSKYPNIIFLGQLPHDAVLTEMEKAIALIFSSKCYECMPMVIAESYKSLLPVISSDVGNGSEMVKEGITGIHFKSCDENSLIQAISKLEALDISCLKRNIGHEYYSRYCDKIGFDNLISIYNRVILNGHKSLQH